MSKRIPSQPPLPKKIELRSTPKPVKSPKEWEGYMLRVVKHYRKLARQREDDILERFDLTDALFERRKRAVLNTMERVQKEYGDETVQDWDPNYTGKRWVALCISGDTFEELETEQHILRGAAIWILDQIANKRETRQKLMKLLPTEDWMLDPLYDSHFWHPKYSFDLVQSVVYVLLCRNTEHPNLKELDQELPFALTDEPTALGTHRSGSKGTFANREHFEKLLELIPRKAIENAVQRLQGYYWPWVRTFYEALRPYARRLAEADQRITEAAKEHNRLVDLMSDEARSIQKLMKQARRAPRSANAAPVRTQPLLKGIPTPDELFRSSAFGRTPSAEALQTDPLSVHFDRLESLADRIDEMVDKYNARIHDYDAVLQEESRFLADFILTGGFSVELSNPYELCFALLYLIDAEDDLPWTYGPCIGLMYAVCDNLPWGLYEYKEEEDPIWEDFDSYAYPAAKPSSIPDWNLRKYRRKDYEPRSLAQLLYEYTGCLLPADMHQYDGLLKELQKYGVRTKDGSVLLTAMVAMANSQRRIPAFNLKDWRDMTGENTSDSVEQGDTAEQLAQLSQQVKQLRTALHEAERKEREARKELEQVRETEGRERRELADLRELVFNQEQEENWEGKPERAIELPYEVRRSTLIFGGHESWLKPMKELLSGSVRFIDRGYTFDTAILRSAEAIWIQPNAMSHPMYYRIIDQARRLKKPVRYFTNASAAICAQQVAMGEQGV